MNYIDILLGIILLLAAFRGFRKGFVTEAASLAALILGIWGAIKFSTLTSDYLIRNFNLQTEYLYLISFLITFLIIVILVRIFGSSVNKLIQVAMLGFLNKLAGLIFGVLKTALVLSVLILALDMIDETKQIIPENAKARSHFYEPVRKLAPSVLPFIKGLIEPETKSNDEKII